jgi:hypothetical protein
MINISFQNKVVISVICLGLWVYFRSGNTGDLLPNHSLFAVLFVMVGITLNYYDPLFLPIFLLLLYIYSKFRGL